ncbi:hypothetical protein EDD15DRAFT_1334433 [Pisolithus albus]|nr:hypothetical protein EDD15DRAFT_1334433 [Pisolithus albus]
MSLAENFLWPLLFAVTESKQVRLTVKRAQDPGVGHGLKRSIVKHVAHHKAGYKRLDSQLVPREIAKLCSDCLCDRSYLIAVVLGLIGTIEKVYTRSCTTYVFARTPLVSYLESPRLLLQNC